MSKMASCCPSDEGSTKPTATLSSSLNNVGKSSSSVTSEMSSHFSDEDDSLFKSCSKPISRKEKIGSKLGACVEKVRSSLAPCTRELLSSDQRKIEVLVVLFSAVFLFAALATRAGNTNSAPVPPSYPNVGAPPPALSPSQDPQKVPLQPTFPPFTPYVPEDPLDPATTEEEVPTEEDEPEFVAASTYVPGDLSVEENGLLLSTGLKSRIIAKAGSPVVNIYGEASPADFHPLPDAAATFTNPNGDGGWAYVSNSEENDGKGGVGAIYFDASGNVLRYERLLDGTTDNCGGGKTPWGTWMSLEENINKGSGIWEVDPFNQRPPGLTALGERKPGNYESFSYDIRNPYDPKFFFTEDLKNGALRRYSPNPSSVSTDPNTMWRMLYDAGHRHEYLLLNPTTYRNTTDGEKPTGGTFQWTDNIEMGRSSASMYFRFAEGMDCRDGILFFVSKEQKELFTLNLDTYTWGVSSTRHGAFSQPDQIISSFPSQASEKNSPLIYFTEDGGSSHSGIHARDMQGRYFTILESVTEIVDEDETTGLAFSPTRHHVYFALQKNGNVFDIWREDGHPFGGMHLDIKYHASSTNIYR